ncbi:unnamed protein product [Ectocarpus sp. CCAP 1310/34]|nr:unnamed protein product [Ectocarpus sp. CCAP 1310/34]
MSDTNSLKETTRSLCQPSSRVHTSVEPPFMGRFQPTVVRQKPRPEVSFDKGGSDFRCPRTFSCLGQQALSRDVYRSAGRPVFTRQDRWHVPGDKFRAHGGTPISSLGNQPTSTRTSAGRAHFGTSTRSSAKKMYALWSVGQQR